MTEELQETLDAMYEARVPHLWTYEISGSEFSCTLLFCIYALIQSSLIKSAFPYIFDLFPTSPLNNCRDSSDSGSLVNEMI